MDVVPCKDCDERSVGCHSTCVRYKDWRKRKDVEHDFILEAKLKEADIHRYKKEAVKRIMKHKR